MSRSSFLSELKRRNVLRAATLYAAGAWLIVQIATQVSPFFDIPNWVVRWIVVAAAIGFPFAMLLSWFYELTPEGFKRENDADVTESVRYSTGRKLDFAIIGVLSLAVVLLLADRLVLHRGQAAADAVPGKSIAVLPFRDLSPNHDQSYFSDGMSEELLNALAQVKDLKVAGRTSSFHFRDAGDDLSAVGKALGVANVLEGSVRTQDNKVRIAARLVEIADGRELWSHEYDGDLSDVFKLQEDIAQAIAGQLRIVLVGEQKSQLVPELTSNPEAHALYLRASDIFVRRDGAHFPEAISDLRQAIALDPKFARAHARLGAVLAVASNYTTMDFMTSVEQAETESRAALTLNPKLAEAHAVLGLARLDLRDYVGARTELEQALAIDPRDTTALGWLGALWIEVGYTAKATEIYDRILAIDPLLPSALAWRGGAYFRDGDSADGRRVLEKSVALGLSWGEARLADLDYADGRKTEAIAGATRGMKAYLAEFPEGTSAILAQGFYADDPQVRMKAVAAIDAYLATKPKTPAGAAAWGLLRMGEPARALELAAPAPTGNDLLFLRDIFSRFGKDARALPQFGSFLRQMGIATFWDRYGPPPGCRRKDDDAYACD